MEKLKTGEMIEWQDLDKKKYYMIGPSFFLCVRGVLYPFNLIKTRLFMQPKTSQYRGMLDAFRKVVRHEGVRGLYKGFLVSSFGMLSGQLYITTYEVVRSRLGNYSSEMKGLIAGASATLVGQSVTVPVDVVTQIMMMQGQVVSPPSAQKQAMSYIVVKNVDYIVPRREKVQLRGAVSIAREIVQKEGLKGLYRGYLISLMTYAPNSALWWASYTGFYRKSIECDVFSSGPGKVPLLVVQAVCGLCAGVLAAIITNPLDVFRTRYQVSVTRSEVVELVLVGVSTSRSEVAKLVLRVR